MTVENPYRAAGAFAGKAYIRRGADAELVEQIRDNQYYPYFAAPRQSGKSSLIARTMASLDPAGYRCAQVDLSPFVVRSYDEFWRQFLHEVARSANFDPTAIQAGDPRDVFMTWLGAYSGRLVVFVDEIDVLLQVECREQIFSKFRTFFNLRAHEPALRRLQFVLAGAAHSSRFISDPRWSPFNVAVEISLEDLSSAQVSQLASYLATAGAFAGPDLVARVYELTGGSVFLCQLVFEALWNRAARGKSKLVAEDVDAIVESIVAESPRNIHFYNIFRLVTQDARLAMLFRRMVDGEELGEEDRKELQLTGICRGMNPFRNDVYARVFGAGGPLDLKVAGAKVALGRKLEAAIARRQQQLDAGEPTSAVESEIAALKREFREGAKLREGDVLGRGRYRLLDKLGEGGFATVWHARDESTQREVAIKVLHGQFAEDKTRRDRFFRGAWKMAELRHPGVVQVLEPYGEEGGRHYFVMEYMPGGTLHEAVLDKKMKPDAVIEAVLTVGKALAQAHERGLVHRDVKPSNVMLAESGAAKLTDFDLVREQDGTGSTRTGPMGSFIYAAPEAMNRPQDADHRADVYGLAMTTVFGLFGAELPLDVVRDADRFIDRLRCGGLVKDVLKKGVAWDIDQRFRSAAEFATALSTAWRAAPEEEAAPAAAAGVVVALPLRARTGATARAAEARRDMSPKTAAGAAVAVAAGAAAGAAVAAAASPGAASSSVLAAAPAGESAARRKTSDVVVGAALLAAPMASPSLSSAEASVPARAAGPAAARSERPEGQAAPAESRPSRGFSLAMLGVLASAAIVLLAWNIGGPDEVSPQDPAAGSQSERQSSGHGTAPVVPPEKKSEAKRDQPPTKMDDPTGKSEPTSAPPPVIDAAGETGEAEDAGDPSTTAEAALSTAIGETGEKKTTPANRPSAAEQIDEGCRKVKGGDAEAGVQVLTRVREDKPRDLKLLGCLGDGLLKTGDYLKAENFFLQVIEQYPRHRLGYLGVAQANELVNRRERAAIYYERLLAIDPENRSAQAFFAGSDLRGQPRGGLAPLR